MTPPPAFGAVTFSAFATLSHQRQGKGISGHPLALPWSRRREVCVSYMARGGHLGGFDFIGLKHCHLQRGRDVCALSAFHAGLNATGQPFGTIDAVIRPTLDAPEKGDTLSILFRKDIWAPDLETSGPVWHQAVPPADQPGSHGYLFNQAAFRRIGPADGVRPDLLHVYNIRMRDKHSPALDLYRAMCFGEICAHIAENVAPGVPVVLLCDTNAKVPNSPADRLLRGKNATLPGLSLRPRLILNDSYLDMHPTANDKVRTQHNFVSPGKITGKGRNNRVLHNGDQGGLETVDSVISTWSDPQDGGWPSYHYPVEAWFRTTRS